MENLRPVFIAGFSLFFAGAVLIGSAYLYFATSTRKAARGYSPEEYVLKMSKSLWVYLTLLNVCLAFGLLYLLQYFGSGLAVKPSFQVVVWLRWLFYVGVGGLLMGLLNYTLTRKPHGAQSFFSLILYMVAMLAVFAATISQHRETQLCWIVGAVVWFLQSLLALFWPLNRICGGSDYARVKDILFSEPPVSHILFPADTKYHEASLTLWAFIYRILLLASLVVSHAGLLVAWFLSDSNDFTHVGGLRATMIAFLVFDLVLVAPFLLLFTVLTAMGVVRKFSATQRTTGHKRIESRVT
jgi:hypothetical protein